MKMTKRIMAPAASLILMLAMPLTSFAQGAFQASNAIEFGTGVPIAGGATLTRDDDSVEVRGALSGIKKKSTFSVWWIIFNNPAGCEGGGPGVCGESDVVPGGDADAGVRNAAGFITGTDGTGYFVGELEVGPAPDGMVGFGQLNDSLGAEIHLVIQTHGAPAPGSVATQMTIPGGACNPDCADLYAVIFAPPAP